MPGNLPLKNDRTWRQGVPDGVCWRKRGTKERHCVVVASHESRPVPPVVPSVRLRAIASHGTDCASAAFL
jgi:hypothetical protein